MSTSNTKNIFTNKSTENLNTINLRTNIKCVMNPKLETYTLHSPDGQYFGFHSLIPFLKATRLVNSVNSKGTISQILGPKYKILLLPWKTDLMFGITKSELSRKL